MGNYTRTNDRCKGSSLQCLGHRTTVEYKNQWVSKQNLKDDKYYDVIIHESEDSEGWCFTRYEITGNHPELNKMIKQRKYKEDLEKEIDKREKEYYKRLQEKYNKIPKEILINRLIELEKDIKRVLNNVSSLYGIK